MRASKKLIPTGGMTKRARQALGMRQCPDIGLWALDNGLGNCKWKTEACADCYNWKTMIYSDTRKCWSPGGLDDQKWAGAVPGMFSGLNRVRLNTRGEPFSTVRNVHRVGEWVAANPRTLFWIVTRAWQTGQNGSPENWYRINEAFMKAIEENVRCYPNARVQASIDDWTAHHWPVLRDRGWSTMFYSKAGNVHPALGLEGSNVVKCRKTWTRVKDPQTGRYSHPKAVCRTCRTGCFAWNRTDVWLKYHQ